MASADRVVSGVVRQVSHVPTAEDHPITEHDPLWQDAVVDVHGQLAQAAGDAPSEITVRFASSRDISWRRRSEILGGGARCLAAWVLPSRQR